MRFDKNILPNIPLQFIIMRFIFLQNKNKFEILNFLGCSKHRFLVQKVGSGDVGSMKKGEHDYDGGDTDNDGGGDSEEVEM